MRGLIITEPWISKILSGEKTWEIRSTGTKVRGQIALIRKGSGMVVGTATLTGAVGPLSFGDLRSSVDRHCVPVDRLEAILGRYPKPHAWVLRDAVRFDRPVPYDHPSGAVIWVRLPDGLEDSPASARDAEDAMATPAAETVRVPVAKDGTFFNPKHRRAGGYQIGAKGSEQWIDDYWEALRKLERMQSPKWRRPNNNGNYGIVTGIDWIDKEREALERLLAAS